MKLSEILDVDLPPPTPPTTSTANTTLAVVVPTVDVSASANNDVSQDALEARNNVRVMIAQGNQAVLEMLALAKDLKTPRAYEVAANLLKTMAELSQDLMAVHLQEATLIDPETAPTGNVNIGTAVFVGSTSDLQDMIKLKREEKKKITVVNPVTANTP